MITKTKAVSSTPSTTPARITMRVKDIVLPSAFTTLYSKRTGAHHVQALCETLNGEISITPIVDCESRKAINNHAEIYYLQQVDPKRTINVQLTPSPLCEEKIGELMVGDIRKTGKRSFELDAKEVQILLNSIGKHQGQQIGDDGAFDRIKVISGILGLTYNMVKQLIKIVETAPCLPALIDYNQKKGDKTLTASVAFDMCTRVTNSIKLLPKDIQDDIREIVFNAHISPDEAFKQELETRNILPVQPVTGKSGSNTKTNYFTNIPKVAVDKPINAGQYEIEEVCDLLFMNMGMDDAQYTKFKARLVKLLSDSFKK